MNPLKQGLKPGIALAAAAAAGMHLSMNPLKQGLKLATVVVYLVAKWAFIHESIKTRVETSKSVLAPWRLTTAFIHESIKTRVETRRDNRERRRSLRIYP